MAVKGILFNTEMVRAILDGKKKLYQTLGKNKTKRCLWFLCDKKKSRRFRS